MKETEITVQVLCSYKQLTDLLLKKGFVISEKHQLTLIFLFVNPF